MATGSGSQRDATSELALASCQLSLKSNWIIDLHKSQSCSRPHGANRANRAVNRALCWRLESRLAEWFTSHKESLRRVACTVLFSRCL